MAQEFLSVRKFPFGVVTPINLAKQRGAYRGRKKALAPAQAEILRQRVRDGEEKAHLAREFGISRETVYQYIRSES
jgi:DNA invertase Pin-like site-specific DNA recombinase